jgi:GTP pyrophosphokinase
LRAQGIVAQVHGRPKHIYSIVKKMRGKSLDFEQVLDVRALRVIVPDVKDCYAALAWVHSRFSSILEEFDDYIARPKPTATSRCTTVVRDAAGAPIEIQIRTQAMHEHAEHGVAAHWAYKEAGPQGLRRRQRFQQLRHQDRGAAPAAGVGARPLGLGGKACSRTASTC